MKSNHEALPLSRLSALYDSVELAILFDWLGIERPAALSAIDIAAESAGPQPESGPIRLLPDVVSDVDEHALGNAVARLVLSGIQTRLPQWAVADRNGNVALARQPHPEASSPRGADAAIPV